MVAAAAVAAERREERVERRGRFVAATWAIVHDAIH